MENKSYTLPIAIGILVILIAGAAYFFFSKKTETFKVGDKVFAEWAPKAWYSGKIDKTCDKGFHVVYSEGDERCLDENKLIIDNVPKKDVMKVGTKVIAQWAAKGPYYDATITEVKNDTYTITYTSDKTTGTKTLEELRLDERKNPSTTEGNKFITPVTSEAPPITSEAKPAVKK